MNDLRREFEQAVEDARHLSPRPDNDTLLRLYALYKQATDGNIQAAQPGFFDFVGTSKHEAWSRLRGIDAGEAMRRYVALVRQLRA